MKRSLPVFACLFFMYFSGMSQNVGVNSDGSLPETNVMLDVKGANAKTATALQNIFQVKSSDASSDALKLRLGLQTHVTPGLRYGVIEVPEYVGSAITAYRHLALQPLGGFVGIGTSAPSVHLEVSGSDVQTAVNIVNTTSTAARNPRLNIYNYGPLGAPVIEFHNARGTSAVPTATLSGDGLGNLDFDGYTGSGFVDGVHIETGATENWSATAQGSYLMISNKANGTASFSERMRIDQNGNVGIGISTPTVTLHVANEAIGTPRGIMSQQSSTDGNSAFFVFRKGRGTILAPTAVVNGDNLGTIYPEGYDGTQFLRSGAFIKFSTNGAIAAGSIPTDICFNTGSSGLGTERLRITSTGIFQIPLASLPAYANNAAALGGGLTVGCLYRTGGDPDVICVVH